MHVSTTHLTPRRIASCPECGGHVTDGGMNERVCGNCGLVVADSPLDRRPSQRTTDPDRGGRGVGSPSGPGRVRRRPTFVGRRRLDARRRAANTRQRHRHQRLRTHNRRAAADARGQVQCAGRSEVGRLCSALEVGESVGELARVLFGRARDQRLLYGRGLDAVAAAAVYIAARHAGTIRTMDELTAVARVSRGRITRSVRTLQREFDLPVRPPSPVEYLPRVGSALDIDSSLERRARTLLEAAIESSIHSGRDPGGLAGGALYTASLVESSPQEFCQTDVAAAADVTPETIRRRFRELKPLCPEVFGIADAQIESPAARAGRRRSDRPAD